MELKFYLKILLRKWWVVLPAFLVTFTSTVVFTFTQVPIYETTATFVVAPASKLDDIRSSADELEILSRRTEIASTYTEVAISHLINRQAADALGLSSDQKASLNVESKLRAGTNVMEITVSGNDPVLVNEFANEVGEKTTLYANDLYEAFDMTLLDRATIPQSPVKPNKALNLALGSALGLALGVGLAFLSTYLETPPEQTVDVSIFDAESGAYNRHYFMQRLREEMARGKRNQYPLSLALLNVDQLGMVNQSVAPSDRSEALRKVMMFVKQYLRDEDVVARLEGTIFAFLLPDMPEAQAKAVMEKLQNRIAWTPFEIERSGAKLTLNSAAGVAAYRCNGTRQDDFLAQADQALQQAEVAGYGKVFAYSELVSETDDLKVEN